MLKKRDKGDRTVLGISGLKDPGTGSEPCPWFTDERWASDKRDGIDGVDYILTYEKLEMWICITIRAGIAASWWRMKGVEEQHQLWQRLYDEALKRLWDEGSISEEEA